MRISTAAITAEGIPRTIDFVDSASDSETNWLTIVTGENGTRKSLLLRLLAGAALGRPTFKAPGHETTETRITYTGEQPQKVFALSGTPSDRFPVVSGIPVARTPTTFDIDAYAYFGPKYAGNVATRLRMITTVMYSLLRDPPRTDTRASQVSAVLEHLGYSGQILLLIEPSRKLGQKVNQARDATLSEMADELEKKLVSSKQDRGYQGLQLKNLISALKGAAPGREGLSALLSRSHRILIDLQKRSIVDGDKKPPMQEIAQLLAAGFLVADDLKLRRASDDGATESEATDRDWIASNDLSSGQWQLINCLLNLALNIEDKALVLVDEPENSLHPEWQREYVDLLKLTMSSAKGCHAVLATHSPLIAAGVKPNEGNILRLRHAADRSAIEVSLEPPVFGWLPGDVLQERFNMESARAPDLVQAANEALALLKSPDADRPQLRELGLTLSRLSAGLPTTDPLLPALEAIVELALSDAQNAE